MSEHPRERDVEQKIKQATEGMPKEAYKGLLLLKKKNAIIIADYLIAYKRERDVKDSTRFNHYCYLMRFARKMNKPFAQVTSEDISTYMDGFEKSEVEDPSHKWKGAYNLFWQIITSFFKWFYDPKSPPSERPKPDVLPHIQKKKHNFKNDEIYKPSDMWTLEEHEIFLKHCFEPRIKCYHAIAASTGGRPDEILSAKIEDIDWPSDGGFPTITLRGKTSKRDVTIYYFIQYLKEWIALHPKRAVPYSYLIYSKKTQGMLREDSLRGIYERDLHTHFTELLDEAIGQDDRKHIEQLLQKPWNPYVIRHSTITYFTKEVLLPDPTHMNQHFGWAKDSMMSARYQHLAGGESNKYLGEKLGLVDSRSKQPKLPKLLECPIVTCRESNNPDTPFCIKCGYPLTVAGHMKKRNREEEAEKQRHQEIEFLKDQIQMLAQERVSLKDEMRLILRNEAEAYRRLFHKQIEDEMKETGKDLRTLVREADHTGGMVTQEGEKPSAAHFAALPSVIKDDIRAMYNELGKLVRTYERVKVTSDNTLQIAQYLFQKVE